MWLCIGGYAFKFQGSGCYRVLKCVVITMVILLNIEIDFFVFIQGVGLHSVLLQLLFMMLIYTYIWKHMLGNSSRTHFIIRTLRGVILSKIRYLTLFNIKIDITGDFKLRLLYVIAHRSVLEYRGYIFCWY